MKLFCSGCKRPWFNGSEKYLHTPHAECKQRGFWVTSDDPLSTTLQAAPAGGDTSNVRPERFQPRKDYVLWKRGLWRGWAVGRIYKFVDVFARLDRDYNVTPIDILEERLAQEIATGSAFFTDPTGVVEFLIRQLRRIESVPPEILGPCVEKLVEAQQLLINLEEVRSHIIEREVLPDLDDMEETKNGRHK